MIGPGRADRHRPVLRRVPQRARRMPGHDRSGVAGGRRPTVRLPVPAASRSATRSSSRRRSPTCSASNGGSRSSAARWAACASLAWAVGVPRARARSAIVIAVGAKATGEQIALCSVQTRAIRADPRWRGGDYYDAVPGDGPHVGLVHRPCASDRSATGRSSSSTQRFGREHQGDEHPLEGGRYAVESYLEYHGEKLARRFDANSYLVLSEAMNHHDVGAGTRRDRAGARTGHGRRHDRPGSRRTASTRSACSTSSPS